MFGTSAPESISDRLLECLVNLLTGHVKTAELKKQTDRVVEAAGVELFMVLITRNLLILGTATTAKKAPLPDPLYVYCTKMLFAPQSNRHHMAATVSHRFSGMDRKST
jgi:hypothetical protein